MTCCKLVVASLLFGSLISANAQKYSTGKTVVSFFSDASIEDISAENTMTAGVFNSASGDIAFSVPVKGFQFEKSRMQEHFNEKYLETDKFPKSTFQGQLTGYDPNTEGVQKVLSQGNLTMHGETKHVKISGTIEKLGNNLVMKSKFIIKLADYRIAIPKLLWQNIAEEVEVTVNFVFKPQ